VALRLLEVLRGQDLPGEVLEAEDPTQTMPRRLGLSDVVERQIRVYREDARKKRRLADHEVRDLFRLVIRRPDAEEIFYLVGRVLAETEGTSWRWRRLLPDRVGCAMARRDMRRLFRKLFGRKLGGFGRGPFSIEARAHLFIESDPGGDACHFVSGMARAVLERSLGRSVSVEHTRCQAYGDEFCRWELTDRLPSAGTAGEPRPPGASRMKSDVRGGS